MMQHKGIGESRVVAVLLPLLLAANAFAQPCKMKSCEEDAMEGYTFCAKHKCPVPNCPRSGRWMKPPSWTKYCICFHKGGREYVWGDGKRQFWATYCQLHACNYQGPVVTDEPNKPMVWYKTDKTSDSEVINLYACDNEKTLKYKYCTKHLCAERLCASPVTEKIEGHERKLSKYCQKHRQTHKNPKQPEELKTASDKCAEAGQDKSK